MLQPVTWIHIPDLLNCLQELHIDGLVQERRNSSALALELRLSCTTGNSSICILCFFLHTENVKQPGIHPQRQELVWLRFQVLFFACAQPMRDEVKQRYIVKDVSYWLGTYTKWSLRFTGKLNYMYHAYQWTGSGRNNWVSVGTEHKEWLFKNNENLISIHNTVGELRSTLCTKTPLYVGSGSYIKQMPLEHLS